MTPSALFINGIFEGVLAEILAAQEARGSGESFIQPFKAQVVKMLEKQPPTPVAPVTLYVSTTKNLSQICYTAEIVGWEDKRELSEERRREVRQHLEKYQPGEVTLFTEEGWTRAKPLNLIMVRGLKRLENLYSTSLLQKVSDGLPLKPRTRSGGWSEVYDIVSFNLPTEPQRRYELDLAESIDRSATLSDATLRDRLSSATRFPERVLIDSLRQCANATLSQV